MRFHDKDLDQLSEMIGEISEVPDDRLAGFAVVVAVLEEDGTASGRLITSTPNLRVVMQMLELASDQVSVELGKLAGLS